MIINTVTKNTIHKTTLTFNQIIIWKAMNTFWDLEPLLQCFKLKWNFDRTHTHTHKTPRGGTQRINRINLKTIKTNLMCSRRVVIWNQVSVNYFKTILLNDQHINVFILNLSCRKDQIRNVLQWSREWHHKYVYSFCRLLAKQQHIRQHRQVREKVYAF